MCSFPGKMCTTTSHFFLWPKDLQDALKEGKEVHVQAPWKLGAGTLQLSVKARKQQAQQLPPACAGSACIPCLTPSAPACPSKPGWECFRLDELLQNPDQDRERNGGFEVQ